MVIVWGEKIVRRSMGFVADFCPLCRGIRRVRWSAIHRVPHLYYIPTGSGKVVGHELTCQDCRAATLAERLPYQQASRSRSSTIDELITETFPAIRTAFAQRLAIEDNVRRGHVDSTLRDALLREPFNVLAYQFDRDAKATQIDLASFIVMLLGLGVFILSAIAAKYCEEQFGIDGGKLALGTAIACTIAFVVAVATSRRRFVNRRIVPAIGRALAPLNPTPDEITALLRQLRSERVKIARFVSPTRLLRAIQQNRQRGESRPFDSLR